MSGGDYFYPSGRWSRLVWFTETERILSLEELDAALARAREPRRVPRPQAPSKQPTRMKGGAGVTITRPYRTVAPVRRMRLAGAADIKAFVDWRNVVIIDRPTKVIPEKLTIATDDVLMKFKRWRRGL